MANSAAKPKAPTPAERGKARAVLNRLAKRYPEMGTALRYRDPWQLLVATILSAQTTDEMVNRVTPELFGVYVDAPSLAGANLADVEKIVHPTGFFRQKTKAIVSMSADLVDRYGGVVPSDLDELVTLHGVGRKTASVVLVEAFGIPAIAVDTHVRRVTGRIGLTDETDPVKIESDLRSLYPEAKWTGVSMRFIQFGRDVCDAKSPRCGSCEMVKLCDFEPKNLP